ncbi:MAG: OmpA family protein [Marinilabiliaceae bacterium]|nr:OmpA family protein [Marinilabiliaceae bacterium]
MKQPYLKPITTCPDIPGNTYEQNHASSSQLSKQTIRPLKNNFIRIKRITFLFICTIMFFGISYSQENPKIDKEILISQNRDNEKSIIKIFNTAEKYYKKGSDYYGEALKYYLRLYQYAPENSAMNYKIGICCLYSSNPKRALEYFIRSYPDVASDYNLHLGRAYQYNLKYDMAQKAYQDYYNTLKSCKKRAFGKQLTQLNKECEFGTEAIKDTLPVFIKNLGPVINSYYDEYSAVFSTQNDSAIFFTSRRPKREPKKIKPRTRYNERILVSNNCLYKPCEEAVEPPFFGVTYNQTLRSSKNLSVSGIVDEDHLLFYYKGKKRNGDIYAANIVDNRLWNFKKVRGKLNHIAYQETSFSADGDSSKHFIDIKSSGRGKKGIWNTAYFVSNRPGGEGGKDIFKCTWKKKLKFKNVENLGDHINTPYNEESVYVTPDGQTLYFSSNGHQGMGGFDIFKCEKQSNGQWGNPVNMGYPINSPANELFYHPTADSMVALIATTRDGGFGGLDIYKVQKDPRIPFELFGTIKSGKDSSIIAATVSIYNYEKDLLISSTPQDTIDGLYSVLFDDKGPYMAQIDAPGYRSFIDTLDQPTKRHDRIEENYFLEKLKYPFTLMGTVIDANTGQPVQAEIVFKPIDNDSIALYRVASNKLNGNYSITIEDKASLVFEVNATDYFPYKEIMHLKQNPNDIEQKDIALKPSKISYHLTGTIYEDETNEIVNGKVSFTKPGEETPFAVSKMDTLTHKYLISVEETGPFIVQVDAEGYFFLNAIQEFKTDSTLELRNFRLKKMKTGAKIVIENILFNSGKSTLKPTSYPELNKLATLLIENKSVKIEVSGHTDNVGSASINKKLSKARALTVRNYLLSKGVEAERVNYEGYGFDQPIADNKTADGRAQNRRVEIKVIE